MGKEIGNQSPHRLQLRHQSCKSLFSIAKNKLDLGIKNDIVYAISYINALYRILTALSGQ